LVARDPMREERGGQWLGLGWDPRTQTSS
jgi:hypothetical protein